MIQAPEQGGSAHNLDQAVETEADQGNASLSNPVITTASTSRAMVSIPAAGRVWLVQHDL
jgi:hypothetical protein